MSDIKTRTMEEAFYLQSKAFFEKNNEHINEIHRLKAEVERLRKAGDEMHRAIKVSDPILDWKIELWNAAKDGKPSV